MVIVACSGSRISAIVADLEADPGKPVITAPQLMLWHCLQLMRVDATTVPRGRLFRQFGAAYRDFGISVLHAPL